jgi:phospholipid/cholesterol/gamma-HCH transport system substrate-binding protein
MALLRDTDPRFKNLERKVGLFVMVALAGVLLTVLGIGVKQELFTPKTRLYFMSDTGQDLHEDMAVKLSGFVIGKVDKVELTEAAEVKVTLSILSEYMKWVKTDSKARLEKEGVIGATIIDISVGGDDAKVLPKDAQIVFERERGLGTVVDQLYAQVQPLIADIRRLIQHADVLIAGLPATQKKLDDVLASAATNLKNLEKITAHEVPAATRSAREAIEGGKKVVDSLQRTWPIRGNIEPPKPALLPMDSYGARPGTANPEPKKP